MKKGVIFGTYSALIGETMGTDHQRRLDRLVDWCKGDDNKEFDGLVSSTIFLCKNEFKGLSLHDQPVPMCLVFVQCSENEVG